MAKKKPTDSHEPELSGNYLLTDKQRAFVLEYVKDYNGTQAAIRAGYSIDSAAAISYENLRKPDIRWHIDRHLEGLGVTADRVLAEQAAIAFSDMGDFAEIQEGGAVVYKPNTKQSGKTKLIRKIKERRKIISSGEGSGEEVVIDSTVELELHDKLKALDFLGKVLGIDKSEQGSKEQEKPHPASLSYTELYNWTEDEKLLYLATNKVPDRYLTDGKPEIR